MRSGWIRPLAACLLAAVALGCSIGVPASDGPAPPPSEADARAYLTTIVGLAMRGDFEGLCALGSGTCKKDLRVAGLDAVPPAPPRIVGTRLIQPRAVSGGWTSGGLVLAVCGIDGRGDPYYDEVLVFRDGSRLISVGTVYWSRTLISDSAVTSASRPTSPPGCPA